MRDQCNIRSMTLHAISFSMYSAAVIAYYYALWYFVRSGNTAETLEELIHAVRQFLITWTVVCYTNFAAQLVLIWIFF